MGDSNNPKDRMRHHRKQKNMHTNAKYKKGPPIKQVVKPPKLDSNWDRYNREPETEVLSSGTDYAKLANMPITHGTQFQFRKDKTMEGVTDTSFESFNLNLELLSMSMKTIPFYRLIDMDINNLTSEQKQLMDNSSVKEKEKYTNYLKDSKFKDDCILTTYKGEVSKEDSEESSEEDESVKETIPEKTNKEVEQKPENELEEWLDDVLDD